MNPFYHSQLRFSRASWVRLACWLGLQALALHGQIGLASLYVANGAASLSGSGSVLSIGWDPSPSPNVTGYLLNWGLASGQCTNQLNLGNVTNTTVGGLETNVTYYFTVLAADDLGQQSLPSNEISYPGSVGPLGYATPQLSFQLQGTGSPAPTVTLSFQGNAGAAYAIQATEDFQQWVTVWMTNCLSDGLIVYGGTDTTNYASRFYRLARW